MSILPGVKNSLTVLEMVARVYQEGLYSCLCYPCCGDYWPPWQVLLSFIL